MTAKGDHTRAGTSANFFPATRLGELAVDAYPPHFANRPAKTRAKVWASPGQRADT